MNCPFCGHPRVRLRITNDTVCLMGETVLCECQGCLSEWFNDTHEALAEARRKPRETKVGKI